ncbi:helix-turn-helix domain-containing protein [Streptomyces sp. NBC_00435]|uniref:helix-turn-helix domain-containing protein n=1 Tax=Streptomyces sp. NBC_00435 TaxID=2903649 RepID=UPI002E1C6CCC
MTQSVTELSLPTPKERRRLREAADLTHDEVAAAVGVTSNTVRSWETGRTHPRGRKREAYAKLLSRLAADQAQRPAPGRSAPAAADQPRPDWTVGAAPGADPRPDRADGPAGQGAGAADTGTAAAPTRPAWANGTAAPQAGTPGPETPGHPTGRTGTAPDGTSAAAPTVGAAPTDADPASAARTASGPAPTGAEQASAMTTPPASAGSAPADHEGDPAEASPAADAPGGVFGLRMRGPARPLGAQTRPKTAVKRAPKPPVGVPRHESKTAVKTAAGGGGNSGGNAGAGPAALRTGGPVTPGPGPGTGSGTGSGPGRDADTGRDTAAGTAPGAGPDADTDTAPGTGPAPSIGPGSADGGPGAEAPGPDPRTAPQGNPPSPSPVAAFDTLYNRTAPALVRQAYLLTGRRGLAREAVERAFQQAWERWPELATDPDPVGWVRAATHEYALSPWHQLRRAHKHPDKPPADPADRVLMDAMLALPPAHRRTVLLYDGVGLDLPDTAAETEASTPTAGNRLVNAHADLADQIPELAGTAPGKQSALLRERLGSLTPAVQLEPRAAAVVRVAGEHRTRRWTRAVVGVTALIAAATAYTAVTAPTEYEPPRAPGANVSGVPPHSGPQQLSDQGRQLHDKLLSDPSAGTARIAPSLE